MGTLSQVPASSALIRRPDRDPLMTQVIGCAIEVHRTLGPGLLESVYERCLAYELLGCGIRFREQVPVPVIYKRVRLECGYRLDLIVEDRVIIEVKCVERLIKLHRAQLLTYMCLTDVDEGFIFNFNAPRLVDGISRVRRQIEPPTAN
jgi:GxxExxY protein